MMTKNEVTNLLQKEAASNPVFKDVAHVFALRKRARHQVTLAALAHRMRKEGFNHDVKEYAPVLKLLARAGFGRLETDTKGRVKALKDVKTTLQSIGLAACGEKTDLEGFRPRNKYGKLALMQAPKTEAKVEPKEEAAIASVVGLEVSLNGKALTIPVPPSLTPAEIADLLSRFTTN